MQDLIKAHITRSIETKKKVLESEVSSIETAGLLMAAALDSGRKLMIAGNGGSAGDSQHIATELTIRYKAENVRRALPAIALTTDSSALTAGGNDFGFDYIFSRQLEALAQEGDIFLAISTSGNSPNIARAIESANERRVKSILLTGESGGSIKAQMGQMLAAVIHVPTQETARIQECHIMIGQILCAIIEKKLFGYD
jgi:D-sedoheptulose 7-phosphate isomerase